GQRRGEVEGGVLAHAGEDPDECAHRERPDHACQQRHVARQLGSPERPPPLDEPPYPERDESRENEESHEDLDEGAHGRSPRIPLRGGAWGAGSKVMVGRAGGQWGRRRRGTAMAAQRVNPTDLYPRFLPVWPAEGVPGRHSGTSSPARTRLPGLHEAARLEIVDRPSHRSRVWGTRPRALFALARR